jgi:hypothetical protein
MSETCDWKSQLACILCALFGWFFYPYLARKDLHGFAKLRWLALIAAYDVFAMGATYGLATESIPLSCLVCRVTAFSMLLGGVSLWAACYQWFGPIGLILRKFLQVSNKQLGSGIDGAKNVGEN